MAQVASGNYFDVLGVKPVLGRLMNAEDENMNPPIAIISERYWRQRFQGDPAVIGKSISFRKQAFTVAGVTPSDFIELQPGSPVDVTLPISIERKLLADSGAFWLQGIIARLKPGISGVTAQAESDVVFRSFMSASRYPADIVAKHFRKLEARPAAHGMDVLRRRSSKPLYALMGIAGLVLSLAIANIANLLLARGISRAREFAIRLAAGADSAATHDRDAAPVQFGRRPRSAVGVLGSRFDRDVVSRRAACDHGGSNLNWRVLAFSLTVTLLAGLVSSLLPVWRAFRTDPQEAIKEGQDRTTEGRSAMMLTQTLVTFQVALAFVLLVGSFTFVRTLANLRSVDPGLRNEDVLTMSVQLPEGYADASTLVAFWNRALETVRRLPGVRAAGISTFTPLSGRDRGALVRVRGYEPATSEDAAIHINQVSEGYFESLGIPLLRGRLLTAGDAEGSSKIALINQSAARKYFGERDLIGERLEFPRKEADSSNRIAGVVGDTKHMNLRETSAPFAFISLRQPRDVEQRVTLVVASSVEDGETDLLQPVRNGLVTIDPGILISDVITIRRQLDSTLLTERLLSGLSSAFGPLALVVASIGLYGIPSYRIGRERQSICIRMALGASPSSVALTVLRRSGAAIATGLLAGLPFAFVAARMADTMLWGVKAGDPMIYISCAALLCAAGIASAYVPARRASAIAPAEALRHG